MFPKGTLISNELIEQQHPVPLKYPVELEEKAKQAVLQENKEELKKMFLGTGELLSRRVSYTDRYQTGDHSFEPGCIRNL